MTQSHGKIHTTGKQKDGFLQVYDCGFCRGPHRVHHLTNPDVRVLGRTPQRNEE